SHLWLPLRKDDQCPGRRMQPQTATKSSKQRASANLATLLLATATCVTAQQTTISMSSGTANPGGTVGLIVSLANTGGAQPSSLQWTMAYPPADISNVVVTAGAAATSASKSISCTNRIGSTVCVIYGMNSSAIGSGTVATASFTIAPGAVDSSA